MTRTMTLETDITAVNTATSMSSQGTVTSPNRNVPSGASVISTIYVSVGIDAAADGQSVFLLTVKGAGIQEQSIVFAAAGAVAPQSGSDTAPLVMNSVQLTDLDLDISTADQIELNVEMMGSDLGTCTCAATLLFS